MSISVFLPVRKHSERVSDKNTRKFSNCESGLLGIKLKQLVQLEGINEIIISTNDPKCQKIAEIYKTGNSRIKIIQRSEELSKSSTDLANLIKHAYQYTESMHILWTHVTSPFFDEKKYSLAIKKYFLGLNSGYDSLITGRNFKEFLLDYQTKKMINNYSAFTWPRTQDLKGFFEINNAVFITNRENYKSGNRSGNNPYLMDCNKISSIDIDDEDDFFVAEAIWEKLNL